MQTSREKGTNEPFRLSMSSKSIDTVLGTHAKNTCDKVSTGISSSKGIFCSPSVLRGDSASAACCFVQVQLEDVELEFRQPQTPLRHFFTSLGNGQDPLQCLMTRPDRETGSFKVRMQKRGGLYNCQALLVRFCQLLLLVVNCPRPVFNSAISSVVLFL